MNKRVVSPDEFVAVLRDRLAGVQARAVVETLRAALLALTDAADDVGVEFFDMEDPPIAVAQMQSATLAARAALQEPTP